GAVDSSRRPAQTSSLAALEDGLLHHDSGTHAQRDHLDGSRRVGVAVNALVLAVKRRAGGVQYLWGGAPAPQPAPRPASRRPAASFWNRRGPIANRPAGYQPAPRLECPTCPGSK